MQRRVTIKYGSMAKEADGEREGDRGEGGRKEMRHKLEIQGRENIFMHLEMYKY